MSVLICYDGSPNAKRAIVVAGATLAADSVRPRVPMTLVVPAPADS